MSYYLYLTIDIVYILLQSTAPTQKSHVISATANYFKNRWITCVRAEIRNNIHPVYDALIKSHGGILPSGNSMKDFEYTIKKEIWMSCFKKGKLHRELIWKAEQNNESPPDSPDVGDIQLSASWVAWYRLG